MLPSTIMSLAAGPAAAAAETSPAEPPAVVIYLLAAGMGMFLGLMLGTPQWVALRQHVRRAGWWVPANALAWMVGMPLVFLGATNVPAGPVTVWTVLVAVLPVLAAGAAVGAIHGIALVWLARKEAGQPVS